MSSRTPLYTQRGGMEVEAQAEANRASAPAIENLMVLDIAQDAYGIDLAPFRGATESSNGDERCFGPVSRLSGSRMVTTASAGAFPAPDATQGRVAFGSIR
jgi:hypothetical protein